MSTPKRPGETKPPRKRSLDIREGARARLEGARELLQDPDLDHELRERLEGIRDRALATIEGGTFSVEQDVVDHVEFNEIQNPRRRRVVITPKDRVTAGTPLGEVAQSSSATERLDEARARMGEFLDGKRVDLSDKDKANLRTPLGKVAKS